MSILFIILAAFFNAVMDATENENFHESILKNLNPKFWYKRESWMYARKVFGTKIDAWHIAKFCMVASLAFAIILHKPFTHWIVEVLLFGGVWNAAFVVTYHKILKVK